MSGLCWFIVLFHSCKFAILAFDFGVLREEFSIYSVLCVTLKSFIKLTNNFVQGHAVEKWIMELFQMIVFTLL